MTTFRTASVPIYRQGLKMPGHQRSKNSYNFDKKTREIVSLFPSSQFDCKHQSRERHASSSWLSCLHAGLLNRGGVTVKTKIDWLVAPAKNAFSVRSRGKLYVGIASDSFHCLSTAFFVYHFLSLSLSLSSHSPIFRLSFFLSFFLPSFHHNDYAKRT